MNLSNVTNIKIPEGNVVKIVSGSDVLWEKDYSKEYFTIEFYDDTNTKNITVRHSVSYSFDKKDWTSVEADSVITTTARKVFFKNVGDEFSYSKAALGVFSPDTQFKASGNIMSLLYGDDFIGKTELTSERTFYLLLAYSKVVDERNLILPATKLTVGCYRGISSSSSTLLYAPKVLPAKTAYFESYRGMFYFSTQLKTCPDIMIDELVGDAVHAMCFGTQVTSVKIYATKVKDYYDTTGVGFGDWLRTASNGVLYKPSAATYDDSALNLPSTWTVETY